MPPPKIKPEIKISPNKYLYRLNPTSAKKCISRFLINDESKNRKEDSQFLNI